MTNEEANEEANKEAAHKAHADGRHETNRGYWFEICEECRK